ncbi:MAG: hypothetical protein K2L56_05060, partial [Prevotella sp.]|nr:hypothetical protein [Prevotella sp.]
PWCIRQYLMTSGGTSDEPEYIAPQVYGIRRRLSGLSYTVRRRPKKERNNNNIYIREYGQKCTTGME